MVCLCVLLGGGAVTGPANDSSAAGRGSGVTGRQIPLSVETFELSNGLKVAFLRTESPPVVAVEVWYRAGSKDEPSDRRGSAHMFEHMMFKGTQRVRPEAHAQELARLGGYVNAHTDEDATSYINVLPADYLDFAMELEAERMRNLLFRKPTIETEKAVVKEEIRQLENAPIAKGFLRFLAIAYTKHPYAWTAGGTLGDLETTTASDLKRFYDTYYQPNNAMLVVVGASTLERVKAAAQTHFGAIPRAPDPPRPAAAAQEPAQASKRREVVEPGQIGLSIVGWHIPNAKHKDVYALQLASIVLGSGDSSRIKVRLQTTDRKDNRPLALEGGAEAIVREDPGLIVCLGAYLDPDRAERVEAALFDEVAKLGAKGPTESELQKAKNQVQASFIFSLDRVQGVAEAIGRSWILTGDPRSFLTDVEEIAKVTAGDIRRVVTQYMTPDKATVVVIPPVQRTTREAK